MATVYLAHDIRHDRKVALKVLRPELAATLGPERFLREVKIAAHLTHPHILALHDSGEAGGFLYYVMPYIEGESLRARLVREGELPVAEAARVLRDVVDALAYAHQHGVIHRDIKPENLLLSGRHTLVTDFGIAKAVSEATGRQGLTTAGVALGTPAYMAPEQAAAEPAIDQRADIYAVGALAYELLTGRPPFTGTTTQQILAAQVIEKPVHLTTRRPSVPPAMAELVMKCLEKKPADRWQHADELMAPLEAAITPMGGSTPTAIGAASRRSGTRARFAAVGLLSLALFGGGGWWLATRRPAVRVVNRLAVLPLENASGDTSHALYVDGMTRAVIEVLTEARVRVIGYRSVQGYAKTQKPLSVIARELGADGIIVGSVRQTAKQVQVSVELTDPTTQENRWARTFTEPIEEVLTLQRQIAREIAHQIAATLTPAVEAKLTATRKVDPSAYTELLLGRVEMVKLTQPGLLAARRHLERAIAIDSAYAPAWAKLANVGELSFFMKVFPDSITRPLVERSAARALGLDSSSAEALLGLGMLRLWEWNFPEAERELRKAASLSQEPDVTSGLASLLALTGRADEAIRLYEEVIIPAEPRLGAWRHFKATMQVFAGQLDRALASLDSALTLDPDNAQAHSTRAWVRALRGRHVEAAADLDRAEAIVGDRWSGSRAYLLALAGRRTDALRALAEVDQIRRTVGQTPDNPAGVEAFAWLTLGDTTRALLAIEQAAAVRSPNLLFVLTYPMLAPLHRHPRFQAVRQRVFGRS